MFSLQVKCLNLTGLYRNEAKEFPKAFIILQIFSVIALTINMTSALLFVITNTQDILACAEAFAPVAIEFLTLAKFLSMLASKGKIYQLMDRCKELASKVDTENLSLIQAVNEFDRKIFKLYLGSGVFTGIAYIIRPLVANLVRYFLNSAEFVREMPVLQATFPYDVLRSPIYEISYFIFSWATHISVTFGASHQSIFDRTTFKVLFFFTDCPRSRVFQLLPQHLRTLWNSTELFWWWQEKIRWISQCSARPRCKPQPRV